MRSLLRRPGLWVVLPLLLLVLLPASPTLAQCHNCSKNWQQFITPTPSVQTVSGSVPYRGQYVVLAHLCAGVTYQFDTCSGPYWDTYLNLYTGTCGYGTANDDGCGYPRSLMRYTPSQDGAYLIIVSSFGCYSGGSFNLRYWAISGTPNCFGTGGGCSGCATQASVDSLEGKLDILESKEDAIEAKADSLEVKLDGLQGTGDLATDILHQEWEEHLCALDCTPQMWLPAAEGGSLEEVRAWVRAQIDNAEQTGDRNAEITQAQAQLRVGDGLLANDQFVRACLAFGRALQHLSEGCR